MLSHPCDYAIRALSELVLMSDEGPGAGHYSRYVVTENLCRNAGLPRDYVAKIFGALAEAKILASSKGPGGGFALAKPAHDISLLSVIEAVDGEDQIDWCIVRSAKCDERRPCRQHNLFHALRRRMRDYLQTTTLADAAASIKRHAAIIPDAAQL